MFTGRTTFVLSNLQNQIVEGTHRLVLITTTFPQTCHFILPPELYEISKHKQSVAIISAVTIYLMSAFITVRSVQPVYNQPDEVFANHYQKAYHSQWAFLIHYMYGLYGPSIFISVRRSKAPLVTAVTTKCETNMAEKTQGRLNISYTIYAQKSF